MSEFHDIFLKAYERRRQIIQNHLVPGAKYRSIYEQKWAQLMMARMCEHEWLATEYGNFMAVRCNNCGFSFLMNRTQLTKFQFHG